jgi:AcrR family transcriptional regulator
MARPKTRKPLTRQRVLEQAIVLADRDGVDALSMRKLGQALGVEAMSLYNHVANKAELVSAMVDSVVEQFDLPEDEARWDAAIRRCATSAHDLLREHPWACSLALMPHTNPIVGPRMRYMEWLLRRLREAGFTAELAYSAYHTLDSHIFGFTLWQADHANAGRAFSASQGEPIETIEQFAERFLAEMRGQFPYLAEHAEQHMAPEAPSGRHEFEFGLELILDGLKRRRRAA